MMIKIGGERRGQETRRGERRGQETRAGTVGSGAERVDNQPSPPAAPGGARWVAKCHGCERPSTTRSLSTGFLQQQLHILRNPCGLEETKVVDLAHPSLAQSTR